MYEQIFEHALDMILVADVGTGVIVDANPAAAQALGYARDELVGMHQRDLHPPQDMSGQVTEIFHNHRRGRTDQVVETQVKTKDGRVLDVAIKASIIEDDNGRRLLVGVFRDMTEQRRFEAEINDLARFPEENPHPVMRADRRGKVVYANSACRNLGKNMGCELDGILPQELREAMARLDSVEPGHFITLELDIGERTFQFTLSPTRADLVHIYGQDITHLKQARHELEISRERYRLAQQAADMGTWEWDIRDGGLYWSEAIEPMFGYGPGEFTGTVDAFWERMHPEDLDRVQEAVRLSLEQDQDYDLEHRVLLPDGTVRWIREIGAVFRDSDGRPERMLGVGQDVTDRHKTMERLRILSRAVEQSPVSVIITDTQGNIEYANPKFTQVSGYALEEVLGRNPRLLKSGCQDPAFYQGMWETILSGREWRGEFCNLDKQGREYWESASISPVTDDSGRVVSFVAVKEEITERKRAEERIRRLALYDPLTGLYNRGAIMDHLGKALGRAERAGRRAAFLFVDLDGFKAINDELGHQAGDQVLRTVAERFGQRVRQGDELGRLGGDEFGVVLQEFHAEADVEEVASRLLESLEEPITVQGRERSVGASIGIALYPEHARDMDELVRVADEAMYSVKDAGRGAFAYPDPAALSSSGQ